MTHKTDLTVIAVNIVLGRLQVYEMNEIELQIKLSNNFWGVDIPLFSYTNLSIIKVSEHSQSSRTMRYSSQNITDPCIIIIRGPITTPKLQWVV